MGCLATKQQTQDSVGDSKRRSRSSQAVVPTSTSNLHTGASSGERAKYAITPGQDCALPTQDSAQSRWWDLATSVVISPNARLYATEGPGKKPAAASTINSDKFPCSTTDPELLQTIKQFVARLDTHDEPDVGATDAAGRYLSLARAMHERFESLVTRTDWEQCERGDSWTGYTMRLDGLLGAKSVARICSASPVEVLTDLSSLE